LKQFSGADVDAIKIHVVEQGNLQGLVDVLSAEQLAWLKNAGFSGALGSVVLIPSTQGSIDCVVLGWGETKARARDRFHFARVREKVPEGTYGFGVVPEYFDRLEAALAWGLSGYRFDRYKQKAKLDQILALPADINQGALQAIVDGEFLTRDLINTPASDMGPDDLEAATKGLAQSYGATIRVIKGYTLLAENFPMIHAVGRAAEQQPRLIDLRWGKGGPKITLVGKGVCFDTGGLNIKPGASMGLMKKDMGGAANVLGLAHMVMATDLPVQLRVLLPVVENSISATAYRPGDVLTSRSGLTVEINNTDAEGRLVLADALALASEEDPDLLVCMATLTGAARVAVGPDLAPFYTDNGGLASLIEAASINVSDPVWRMPLWQPYESMIEPKIADLDNAPKGGFAGSITAALFLRRFTESENFVHFDIFGWSPSDKPGRPTGGVGMGTRALFEVVKKKAAS
jgi:leucyl aminopeptidase